MLVFSVASLWVKILIHFQVILMKKTPFEHYCSIFSDVYQNNDKLLNDFPPTSGLIPPTSGSSD